MRCSKAQKLISELLDGELGEKEQNKLQAHLRTCPECSEVYKELVLIKTSVARAESLEPSETVWEGIKTRLQSEVIASQQERQPAEVMEKPGSKLFRWFQVPRPAFRYAVATFVFLAFMAGAFYLGRYHQTATQTDKLASAQNATIQKIQEAEFHYQKATEALSQALQSAKGDLPPQMVEVLETNLKLLDRAIELCQQAVNQQPYDLKARDYLLSAYNDKMTFLNNMLETERTLISPGV
jgi:tetratricopeptide (TPR) repeat protein